MGKNDTLFEQCLRCILRRLHMVDSFDVPNLDDYNILKKYEEEREKDEKHI